MILKLNFNKMQQEGVRYIHDESVHNFTAAREMVPFIMDLVKPNSVVDVGCGTGTWLKVFEDNKIADFVGIDGAYVDKASLKIKLDSFVEHDLETFYTSSRNFDLVISLEVAEHLKEQSAEVFIKTLVGLGDTVIFSAAIPNQGGQNHLNEREPAYWISKFEKERYKCYDVLRPVFWDNEKVDCWYRQNILLFTKNTQLEQKLKTMKSFLNAHLVHPELLRIKEGGLEVVKSNYNRILDSKEAIKFYRNLIINAIEFKIKKRLSR
ncbi:class I SAM-dependent methyltransferase [Flavobacterium sp. F-380]|uniref:Class I SAM-dependent methyltransferase n=1 Tax=Flavobacterium kayseriense TaxID=2764714 RepID=A0ABR7J7D4_9FLAO|nr:class I SAM-dependent methyltransferase [Flavobacterium kayseriense]MBC5841444.1 class I SAM-dependent methyltransferase [Flavobacterium kayseriense]MBC5847972.1 class I SAM-dependent methyltransferase [Flavobacterium kayseriense]